MLGLGGSILTANAEFINDGLTSVSYVAGIWLMLCEVLGGHGVKCQLILTVHHLIQYRYF